MKRIAALCLSLGFVFSAVAGHEVGGGGIAENNVLFSYWNLEKFIDLCVATPGCGLTTDEAKVLAGIRAALPAERAVKDGIVFTSEKERPDFFHIDGLVRLAKTGYHVGDVIYVNTDLMYPPVVASITGIPPVGRPLDIPIAVSMLVHELGHHQGVIDHSSLDLLGSKVQTLMRTNTQEVDGGPDERHLIATAIDYSGVAASDLLVRDDENVIALTDAVKNALVCPAGTGTVSGFWLWNLHWRRYTFLPGVGELRPLRLKVQLLCGHSPGQQQLPIEIEVDLRAARNKLGRLAWLPGPYRIQQYDCGASPQSCP